MRHFLRRELGGAALAVAGLSRRLQPSAARRDPVDGAGSSYRLAALIERTLPAEASAAITSSAQVKLNTTPTANDDPKTLRRHRLRNRRLLDMELRPG